MRVFLVPGSPLLPVVRGSIPPRLHYLKQPTSLRFGGHFRAWGRPGGRSGGQESPRLRRRRMRPTFTPASGFNDLRRLGLQVRPAAESLATVQ